MTSFYSVPRFRNKITLSFVNHKHKVVLRFLKKNFSQIINEFQTIKNKDLHEAKKCVWILWWQGYANAPELVKCCISSAVRAFKGFDVILITEQNYKEYISVPGYIMAKFKEGKISFAQLSDIFRLNLLDNHGGVWVDSTLFFTKDISKYFNKEFFTLNTGFNSRSYYVAKGRWTGFLMSSSRCNMPFFSFANKLILEYWKGKDSLVDYFLIDYIIALAYQEFSWFHIAVDSLPTNCPGIFLLVDQLDKIVTDEELSKFLYGENWCYKLNHRKIFEKEQNGKPTLYDRILSMNPILEEI